MTGGLSRSGSHQSAGSPIIRGQESEMEMKTEVGDSAHARVLNVKALVVTVKQGGGEKMSAATRPQPSSRS